MKKSSLVFFLIKWGWEFFEATEAGEAVEVIEAAKVSHARKALIMEIASHFFISRGH